MNNPMQIMQQFQNWKQGFERNNPGINPQEYVQKLMNEGKVSQQQFEQARNFASMMGMKL
jgi:hypothetical protein